MRKKANQIKIAGFLTLAIIGGGFIFGDSAAAQSDEQQRISQKPTPTPGAGSIRKIMPAATPTAVPTPILTPTPLPVFIQSVAELQTRIRATLTRPELRRGQIGVKIVSLDTGGTIFEENAEKYFMPASNMKNYTVAAALEKLSPDFRFVTSVFAPALPDASGTIQGDLVIYGRGDVSFSNAFYDGDYYKGVEALASKIAQSGVKRVEGNLVGDESYFTGSPIPPSWEWDDLQWYYGAEVSALGVNDNAVGLSIKPASINQPCRVLVKPINTLVKIVNRCVISPPGTKREIRIEKKLPQNIIEISGTMPSDDKGYDGFIAVSRPAELFVEMLRQLLIQKGVFVTGRNRVIGAKDKAAFTPVSLLNPVEIAKLESPPLSLIAAKTMKPSQNLYTETILWTLGEQLGDKTNLKLTSAERGLEVVRDFLAQTGISADSVIQWDGSGLSRHNLITPSSSVRLYEYMTNSRHAEAWRDSLTIGAVDGTLRNRFKGTRAAGNVRGKTGTIDQVSALSGYVTSAAGEKLVFSILVNGVNDVKLRQAAIDEIVVSLANFNGKSN